MYNLNGHRRTRSLALFITLSLSTVLVAAQTQPPARQTDQWATFRFLLGTWEATTSGGSAGATSTGKYTFQLELKDHVLVRHSESDNCKGPTDFNCGHLDELHIFRPGPAQRYEAIYFDTEGHAIHYFVSVPAPNTVVFLSDNLNGPQYRLSYELKGSVMYGKFQMRPEGQTAFRSYLEWSGKKL